MWCFRDSIEFHFQLSVWECSASPTTYTFHVHWWVYSQYLTYEPMDEVHWPDWHPWTGYHYLSSVLICLFIGTANWYLLVYPPQSTYDWLSFLSKMYCKLIGWFMILYLYLYFNMTYCLLFKLLVPALLIARRGATLHVNAGRYQIYGDGDARSKHFKDVFLFYVHQRYCYYYCKISMSDAHAQYLTQQVLSVHKTSTVLNA